MYIIKYQIKYVLIIAAAILLLMIPLIVKAEHLDLDEFFNDLDEFIQTQSVNSSETQAINQVTASANTGGNIAESGEIIQGEAESSASIKTIINGETVVDEEYSKKGEEEANIKIENKVEVNTDEAVVETNININGEESHVEYTVPINNSSETSDNPEQNKEIDTADIKDNDVEENNFEDIQNNNNKDDSEAVIISLWQRILESFRNQIIKLLNIFA